MEVVQVQITMNEDWSISCNNDIPENGDVILYDSGLILVWLNGQWGTVSYSSWTNDDIRTACTQLGFIGTKV